MPILALHGFTGCGSDFAPFAAIFEVSWSGRVYAATPPTSKMPPGPTPVIKPGASNNVASGFTPRSEPVRKTTQLDWHCPDLPGHGSDPQLDCSPDATLRFVDAAAAKCMVQNGTPRVLLGYSMGARAALLHAVNHPDYWDALILISGNPGIEDPAARAERVKTDDSLAESLERMGTAGFLDFWQETPLIRSQKNIPSPWRETMLRNRQTHTVSGLAKSLRQFGQGSCPNLWPRVGELALPVCLISGAKDTKYTAIAARMSELLIHTKSRHVTIEAASHMPHLEQAEATSGVVKDFLLSL